MNSIELNPDVEKRAEVLLDWGYEFHGVYPITETTPADDEHPKIRMVAYDDQAAVYDALLEHGLNTYEIRKLQPAYLESLRSRRPDAERIGADRFKAANLINAALGVRPFDQQG